MDSEKINVCIPTYNREIMLTKLIKSIDKNINIVVSDNGGFITEKMTGQYANVLLKPSNKVLEIFTNWNNAVTLSNAEYVVIPSDDDLYLDNAFDIIISEINKSPDLDVLIFGHHYIDENDNIIHTWNFGRYERFEAPHGFKIFQFGVDARMPSIVFKREFLEKIGLFDTNFKLTAADSDLIQRALLYGTVQFIPKIIACYRVWGGGLTAQKQASKEWLNEIEYWTTKVGALAEKQYSDNNMKFKAEEFSHEILARNILAGAKTLISKGDKKQASEFILTTGIPTHCKLKTKFKLLKIVATSYFH